MRALLALLMAAVLPAQQMRDLHPPTDQKPNVVVIGFLGSLERWNDSHRGVRKVALHLSSEHMPNLYVVTIENRHQALAVNLLERLRPQKTVLYGHSLGGAAVVYTARRIREAGINVELTVQVDSVGWNDTVIPSNVRAAANLYQHDPFTIDGAHNIRAENPSLTRILENSRFSYLHHSIDALQKQDSPWFRTTFGGSHVKMELDQAVWQHVEDLIHIAIR